MRKLKYFTVLMLVGLLALTGCSFGNKAKGDAKERLEKALIKLANADSFTVKMALTGEIDGQDGGAEFVLKLAKEDKYYDVYLNVGVTAEDLDLNIEGYLLTSKKATELYLNFDSDEWSHFKVDNDDIEDTTKVDVDEIATGIDEKEVKKEIKNLKSVKFGKVKNGLTEIIVTIDKDSLDETGYDFKKDLKLSIYVDDKDNLKKIKFDTESFSGFDSIKNAELTIEVSDINSTEVSVPKKVKNNATDAEIEDLLAIFLGSFGYGGTGEPDPDPVPTPVPTPSNADKVLTCKATEEEGEEVAEFYFKDNKLINILMKVTLSSEEEAKQYYELMKAFAEDNMKVELDGKTIIISGSDLMEGYEDITIEDMKSEMETDGATCTIK